MKKRTIILLPVTIFIGILLYFILRSPQYVNLSNLIDSANSYDISVDGKTVIFLDSNNKILQLKLKKAWNFNSIDYESIQYSIIQDKNEAVSIKFSKHGEKLFVTRSGVSSSNKNEYRNGRIQQFTMSSHFDITTLDKGNTFIECECSWPMGLSFDETGQYMQVVGGIATQFFYFHLASPYNIESVKHLDPTFISRNIDGLGHLCLTKATENVYYTIEQKTKSAYQFKMVTDGSYPKLKYDYKHLDLNKLESMPSTILSHPKGKKIFILTKNAKIYTYHLENSFDLNSKITKPIF